VALAILIPWVNRSIRAFLKAVTEWVEGRLLRSPWKVGYIVLGTIAWLGFFMLRERTHLLGDGKLLLSGLEMGHPRGAASELLGDLIPFGFYRLLHSWHLTPENSYAIISCTSGVLFLLCAYLWVKAIAGERDPLGRWLAFGILATMGIVQQFCGYVENYSLLFAAQMAYFLFGFMALEDKCSLIFPAIIFGILVLLHFANLMLTPTLVLLWTETRKDWSRVRKWWTIAIGSLGTLPLIALAITKVGSPGSLTRYVVSLWGGYEDAPGYSLFSVVHLADLGNLLNLASPVFLPLLFLTLFSKRTGRIIDAKFWFLTLATLIQITFLGLFDPKLGAGRDWDLLSVTGIFACSLLLIYLIVHTPLEGRGFLGLTLVWTALFSTAPFVVLNASKQESIQRAQDLALLDPLRDRGSRIMFFANYFREHAQERGRDRFEQRAFEKVGAIIEKTPENNIAHFLRGTLIQAFRGDVEEAQKEYLIVLERKPDFSLAWDKLAETYENQGRLKEAISCYERHVALNSEHTYSWGELSRLYRSTRQLNQEIRCLEKLTQLAPDHLDVWSNLGLALEAKEDYIGAEAAYRKAIRLNPKEPKSHFVLGNTLLFQGKWAEAESECREAIRLDPKLAMAYSNLGAALVQMGKFSDAESNLRQGLTIASDLPELHYNLSLALQGQGKKEEAQMEYETYKQLSDLK